MSKVLNKEEFEKEVLKSKEPVLVDFYADWCGPCKMLIPVLDEIDFTDVIKVNVDEYPGIAQKFGIMSIPSLLFFKNGLEQDREIGYRGIDEIKDTFKKMQ